MKNSISKMLAFGAIFCFSVSANAGTALENIAKTGELRACFDAGYMPFEMKSKNRNGVGTKKPTEMEKEGSGMSARG